VVILVVDVVAAILVYVAVVDSVEVVVVSVVVMSVLESGVQYSCYFNVLRELHSLLPTPCAFGAPATDGRRNNL